MKRIHFTAEDLARIRVATTIGVAAETLDSVKLLKDRDLDLPFRPWQVSVRGRLGEQAGPLSALLPPRGPLLDMASLTGDTASIDEAVDNLLAASRRLVRLELENIEFRPAHRSWARNLVDGDRETRLQVAAALRAGHRATVAPYWNRVRSHLSEARAAYLATMAEGGVEKLLTTLCSPLVRWRPPVLEVDHVCDGDLHLNGRGLVIAPTMFSTQHVEVSQAPLDPARAPVLAVPTVSGTMLDTALWGDVDEPPVEPVDDLLGRTRAAVLRAAADGCSTTQLARTLNIAPATVSHHTRVLRDAHLITTRREGKMVMHTITGLGLAVLAQRIPLV
ncbi:helix-turn-helix domain-containing protein [Streptomyces sp. WI04-05B]|uniref:helix-turn-helix domain-containing protein n=1 Tax=Streptomyces TaxID=1883 RepID=UPI0029BBBCBA|nr:MULTISPECIES: helix-turn-helix domain-containing protein [unclassified Streptomyces]MDX2545096.1 helix-turn-helix domain-containing protein [Streptomyces sp. WI04-05B]MDX2587587.1 helix-turn-helix domain-containing protein [Streptomyces sp. WI04-05A]